MAYDLEEQEKLDALKDWWAQYGTMLVVAALVAAAAVVGWRGWQWYEGHQARQAMGYFEALESAARIADEESMARVVAASKTLRSDFPKSGYTARGVLIAAQTMQKKGDLTDAAAQLEWIINNSTDQSLVPLAKLRLAGVLFEKGDLDAALSKLENPVPSFKGLYADRRGDILFAQGKPEQALEQWEISLAELGNESLAGVIQLKIDALNGA